MKEIKRAKRPDQQLGAEDTFAATPPVECVTMILSLFMSQKGIKKKRKLAVWGISRAHFMGKAERELFVELPQEDLVHPEDQEAMVGRLLRSMYGTQDASKIFQMDYQGLTEKEKGEFSKLCPATLGGRSGCAARGNPDEVVWVRLQDQGQRHPGG